MANPNAPVTDAAQRLIAEGKPTAAVVKISNMTYGRLVTLLEKLPTSSFTRDDVIEAKDFLTLAKESLQKASEERDEKARELKESVEELHSALHRLNVSGAEVKQIQDAITLTLAAIPIAVGAVASAPVALVVGTVAAVGSFVNSETRAGTPEHHLPKSAADLGGGVVDAAKEVASHGHEIGYGLGKALPVVNVASALIEVGTTKPIEAELDGVTDEGFNHVDEEISEAGTWVDKKPAMDASHKARSAMHDLIRAELVLKMKQAVYIKALRFAESMTWVMPR